MSTRGKVRERKGRNLCRITCANLSFNAQIGNSWYSQFLHIPGLSPYTEMNPVTQEIDEV